MYLGMVVVVSVVWAQWAQMLPDTRCHNQLSLSLVPALVTGGGLEASWSGLHRPPARPGLTASPRLVTKHHNCHPSDSCEIFLVTFCPSTFNITP